MLRCSSIFLSKILDKNGVFVSKLFMGDEFIEVKNLAKSRFKKVNFLNLRQAETNQKKLIYIVTLRTL